jgi:hypothetical protein
MRTAQRGSATATPRPSRAALAKWLADNDKTQAWLADAVSAERGYTRAAISLVLKGQDPGEPLARAIQRVTGVSWEGWYTAARVKDIKAREQRAEQARKI